MWFSDTALLIISNTLFHVYLFLVQVTSNGSGTFFGVSLDILMTHHGHSKDHLPIPIMQMIQYLEQEGNIYTSIR
jgi:hypothetical protein